MPGYVGFLINIQDHKRFSEYAIATGPTMAKHGGHVALRGPIGEVVEGTLGATPDTRLVVLEFPPWRALTAGTNRTNTRR